MTSFKSQNPEEWRGITHKHGYACPKCGNHEFFQQFWHMVVNVQCDKDTGYITYQEEDTSEELKQRVSDVICEMCGADAEICRKGVVLDTLLHDEHVELAIPSYLP